MTRQVQVQLGDRSYTVSVGSGLLAEAGKAAASLPGARRAVVIADSNVAALYGPTCLEALRGAGLQSDLLSFPAGEADKTLQTCSGLFDSLFALRPTVDRRAVVVALGGGVTGDVAGFVAATALRGLRFIQCPTTLLAAVDASVGGKTGVDHPAGKNLIGAFHQPVAVLIDVDLLKTLSAGEFANGLAECVKHGVIRDAALLDYLEQNREAILARQPDCLTDLIARNVAIKAAVVSGDERESGQREHLNFGHTVGHAIENCVGYGNISHGQAVALGMVAACRMAVDRGLIGSDSAARVEKLLSSLGLPVRRQGLDARRVWDLMLRDKKALAGKVRMVLPTRLGAVATFEDITPQAVTRAVEYLAKG